MAGAHDAGAPVSFAWLIDEMQLRAGFDLCVSHHPTPPAAIMAA